MAYPVTHFEVNARDAKAMQRFYGDLFGWGIDTNNPMDYGMIDTKAKGRGINGGIGATQNGRSWVTFYVETSSIDDTLGKVERLGGKTIMPKMDMGPGEYGPLPERDAAAGPQSAHCACAGDPVELCREAKGDPEADHDSA